MFRAGTLHDMEFGVVNNMCCYMCIMILLFGLPESMALGFSILKSPTREMVTGHHPGTFSDILIIPKLYNRLILHGVFPNSDKR